MCCEVWRGAGGEQHVSFASAQSADEVGTTDNANRLGPETEQCLAATAGSPSTFVPVLDLLDNCERLASSAKGLAV